MTKHHRRTGKGLFGVFAALLALLTLASPALATKKPTGIWANFIQCPTSNPEVTACTFAETTTGEFDVGSRAVPINKPIILQGGFKEEESGELKFYAAENGETLTKQPLFVPGGLFNIIAPEFLNKEQKEAFEKVINEGITGVTATTELAAPASAIKLSILNLILREGVALQLPVKVKLGNTFLGSKCYVGSEAHPIILNLTTGTTSPPAPNKPITGNPGTLEIEGGGELARLNGGSLVDNAWASPGASGCGTSKLVESIVDEAVNHALGLPSAAGHNTAILGGKLETGGVAGVKESE